MDNFRRYFSEAQGSGLTLSGYRFTKTAASQSFTISIRYNGQEILDHSNIELDNSGMLNGTASLNRSSISVRLWSNSTSNSYTSTLSITYNGETVTAKVIQSGDSVSDTKTYSNALRVVNSSYNAYSGSNEQSFYFTIYPTVSVETGTAAIRTYYSGNTEEVFSKNGEVANIQMAPFTVYVRKDGSAYYLSYTTPSTISINGRLAGVGVNFSGRGGASVHQGGTSSVWIGELYSSSDSIDVIASLGSHEWYVVDNPFLRVYNVSCSCQTPSSSGISIGQDVFIS